MNSSSASRALLRPPPKLTDGQMAGVGVAPRPRLYPGPIPWGVLSRMSQRIPSIDLLQYAYHPRLLLPGPSTERA